MNKVFSPVWLYHVILTLDFAWTTWMGYVITVAARLERTPNKKAIPPLQKRSLNFRRNFEESEYL